MTTVAGLNAEVFDGRLSASVLRHLAALDQERPEVRAFVRRAFGLMARSRFRAEDVSPFFGWSLGAIVPRMLPGAWGGLVPPTTVDRRHVRFDEYVERGVPLERAPLPGRRLRPSSPHHPEHRRTFPGLGGHGGRSVLRALPGVRPDGRLRHLRRRPGPSLLPGRGPRTRALGRPAARPFGHARAFRAAAPPPAARAPRLGRDHLLLDRTRRRPPRAQPRPALGAPEPLFRPRGAPGRGAAGRTLRCRALLERARVLRRRVP